MVQFFDDIAISSKRGLAFPLPVCLYGKMRRGVWNVKKERLVFVGVDKPQCFVGELFSEQPVVEFLQQLVMSPKVFRLIVAFVDVIG